MVNTLPITQARQELTTLVENASKKLAEYVITVNGSPAAVLMSAAEYASWKETMEVLADASLMKVIKQGEKDLEEEKYVTFEELKKELKLYV